MSSEGLSNKKPSSKDCSLWNDDKWAYQQKFAEKVSHSIESQNKHVVLACTTSGGKSYLAIRILEQFFKNDSTRTTVFLGSNLKVLAQQFHDVLTNSCPVPFTFSYSMLSDTQDSKLKIGLPQQLIKKPRKISLLILDESQWLWPQIENNPNSMMAQILRACKPDKILLLTGSPSYFLQNKDSYIIHSISYEEIKASVPTGVFSKVDMSLVLVNDTNDLETCLKSFFRKAKSYRDDISKFAVIAKNIKQAQLIKNILENKFNISCLISTSETDSDSNNLDIFKKSKIQCCITVNRIYAGWSYKDLTCIVDFACTKQINRAFQLFSRLLRYKNESCRKTYYRVTKTDNAHNELKIMNSILLMLTKTGYESTIPKAV